MGADEVGDQQEVPGVAGEPPQQIAGLVVPEVMQEVRAQDEIVLPGQVLLERINALAGDGNTCRPRPALRARQRCFAAVHQREAQAQAMAGGGAGQHDRHVSSACGNVEQRQVRAPATTSESHDRREQGLHQSADPVEPRQTVKRHRMRRGINSRIVHEFAAACAL